MYNNYFIDYAKSITIPKGKLPPKFTMLDVKFHGTENHGTENPNHHGRNFAGAMTLKGLTKITSYFPGLSIKMSLGSTMIWTHERLSIRKIYIESSHLSIHIIPTFQ